jgi:PTS system fructose-specific IIC component
MKQFIQKQKQYLLSGVSFAIPFIASGGILIAVAIGLAPMGPSGPDFSNSPILKHILSIGEVAFKLLLPVLAGYISYAIAGKPGLVAGFVGGFFASIPHEVGGKSANAGFLGAILAGLVAGHIVNWIKKIPVHKLVRPIMPILIIPALSAIAIGTLMFFVSLPIANIMVSLDAWLRTMQSSSAIILAMVLGAMIAFDMGGPVNKTAFFFGASMIEQGNFAVMGAVAAAICTSGNGFGHAAAEKPLDGRTERKRDCRLWNGNDWHYGRSDPLCCRGTRESDTLHYAGVDDCRRHRDVWKCRRPCASRRADCAACH